VLPYQFSVLTVTSCTKTENIILAARSFLIILCPRCYFRQRSSLASGPTPALMLGVTWPVCLHDSIFSRRSALRCLFLPALRFAVWIGQATAKCKSSFSAELPMKQAVSEEPSARPPSTLASEVTSEAAKSGLWKTISFAFPASAQHWGELSISDDQGTSPPMGAVLEPGYLSNYTLSSSYVRRSH
jgi:hypothetical protein